MEQLGKSASSAASHVAGSAAVGGAASSGAPSGASAAGGGGIQPADQPEEVMALGPANNTGELSRSSEEL